MAKLKEVDVPTEGNGDRRETLLTMKFSVQEVEFAISRLGEEAPVNELVNLIVASQIAKCTERDENDPTHGNDAKGKIHTAATAATAAAAAAEAAVTTKAAVEATAEASATTVVASATEVGTVEAAATTDKAIAEAAADTTTVADTTTEDATAEAAPAPIPRRKSRKGKPRRAPFW